MSRMIEVKVSELTGPALDWAAGRALNLWSDSDTALDLDVLDKAVIAETYDHKTDKGLLVSDSHRGGFMAGYIGADGRCVITGRGECPGLAGYRAIVSAKLGETVKIPSELIK